ncbi:MAG TPA: sulfite exporter TauE/SafE family protein [Quisquiliibacterium sp.]|nr:sulfite exporter TauE/SafE family protein [Quisquiliibacterium sp.]
MDISLILGLLVLGAATGFLAGLLGIGGGMVMVPFMTMLLGAQHFPPSETVKVAIATSLTTIVFTSMSSVRAHHRRGAVRWSLVKLLAPGILIGALLGAQVAGWMPGRVLAAFFGVFVGYSALKMLRASPAAAAGRLPGKGGMLGAGGAIGSISALVGAGGGFITVPFLTRGGVPIHQAVATSAACGFPIALAGTLGYVWAGRQLDLPGSLGYVYLPALLCIASASVLTAPLGARAAHALPTAALRKVFAVVLLALAAYMLARAAGA